MSRGQLGPWILRVLIGLAVGLLLRAFMAADSFASQRYPVVSAVHKHLRSMTSFTTEVYCVDVGFAPPMAHADALARVAGPLRLDYPSGDWNGLKGDRVAFGQRDWQCSQPPGSAGIELKYYVENSKLQLSRGASSAIELPHRGWRTPVQQCDRTQGIRLVHYPPLRTGSAKQRLLSPPGQS